MNTITKTVNNVMSLDWYGGSETIEIAKGKYELVSNWKTFVRKLKRSVYGNRKRN